MTPLLAGALLMLAQGPYGPAAPGAAPEDAPRWIAGQEIEEHAFRVSAKFECPPDTVGGLLQVSISDTMVRAEFTAEENIRGQVLSIPVPGKQLQGLRPGLFCPEPAGAEQRILRLESKFTAQGGLICRNAEGRTTTAQASAALDAWVICPAETPEAEETDEAAETPENAETSGEGGPASA